MPVVFLCLHDFLQSFLSLGAHGRLLFGYFLFPLFLQERHDNVSWEMLKKVPTQVDLVATLQAHDPFLKAAPSLLNFFWMWIVLLVHVPHPINRFGRDLKD